MLVIAGQTTRVHLTFEPGIERTLTFPLADPAREWSAVRITVRGSGGRLYRAQSLERRQVQVDLSTLVSLPRGTFEVEAVTDTGLTAHGSFTVEALTDQDAPLVFELR